MFEQATDPPIVIVAGSTLCVVVVESGSQGVNPPNDVLATYATIPSTLVNCNVFTVCSLSLYLINTVWNCYWYALLAGTPESILGPSPGPHLLSVMATFRYSYHAMLQA